MLQQQTMKHTERSNRKLMAEALFLDKGNGQARPPPPPPKTCMLDQSRRWGRHQPHRLQYRKVKTDPAATKGTTPSTEGGTKEGRKKREEHSFHRAPRDKGSNENEPNHPSLLKEKRSKKPRPRSCPTMDQQLDRRRGVVNDKDPKQPCLAA